MNLYLLSIFRFVLLVLIQVLVLNHVRFGGYANPYLYVLFVLMLPYEIPGWLLLLSGFAMGYSIDLFSGTPGIHAASTVFLAFLRPTVLKLTVPKQEFESGKHPSIAHMGLQAFAAYAVLLVSIHHVFLYFLEIFRFSEILMTLLRAGLSSVLTLFLIIITQYLFYPKQ